MWRNHRTTPDSNSFSELIFLILCFRFCLKRKNLLDESFALECSARNKQDKKSARITFLVLDLWPLHKPALQPETCLYAFTCCLAAERKEGNDNKRIENCSQKFSSFRFYGFILEC